MKRPVVIAGAAVVATLASAAAAAPAERVTILARPSVAGPREPPVTVFGSVDSDKAGEAVVVQAKDCGQRSFNNVGVAYTLEGGSWSTHLSQSINRTVRAVWNDNLSAEITIRARARVVLDRLSARRWEVGVGAQTQFWRKRVLIQRFDRRLGTWATLRTVVLTEQFGSQRPNGGSPPGPGGGMWTSAKFTMSIPEGTLLRAFLPLSQARPCYLAGASNLIQT